MISKLVYPFLFFLSLLVHISCHAAPPDSTLSIKGYPIHQYFTLVQEYYSEDNYDAALSFCDTILKYHPEVAEIYRREADIYIVESRWQEAVAASEHAVRLDSSSFDALQDYFAASHMIGRDADAMDIYDRLVKLRPDLPDRQHYLDQATERVAVSHWSVIGTSLFIMGLILLFAIFYSRGLFMQDESNISLPFLLLIPAFVTGVLYFLFYHFSAWIWMGNTHYPILSFNPYSIRGATFEHDGREGFVMYVLVFGVMIASAMIMSGISYLSRGLRIAVLIGLAAVSFLFFIRIGFHPPFEALEALRFKVIAYTFIIPFFICLANILVQRYPQRGLIVVAILLLPICFILCDWFSVYDYGYVLSPALRLSYGDYIRDIYFQYDVYLSLLSMFWIKFIPDIHYIYILSEAGYYIFFLSFYIFSRQLFFNKKLPLLLLVFAILLRYYANMGPNAMFQTTPWRLDLWLIGLWLVHRRGVYHWLAALFLGFLIVFHRNFGFIYLAAYIQMLLVLVIIEMIQYQKINGWPQIVARHIKLSLPNIVIIVLALIGSYFVLGSITPDSALAYRQIGIGMMRISDISFYWYVPVLLGSIVLLLIRYAALLPRQYMTTGVFLILLAIGESLYFFGRSHEHNIINLAGIFSLCLFFFLDILYVRLASNNTSSLLLRAKLHFYDFLPFLFIAIVCIYYFRSLDSKISNQIKSIKTGRWTMPIDFNYDFASLRDITKSSDKVYFLEFNKDFLCYYWGHYKPVGYFTPNDAWVLKKDMAVMLQNLLDSGYYLAPTEDQYADEILQLLKFNTYREKEGSRVYFKQVHSDLLSDSDALIHRAFLNHLPARGISVPAISPHRTFAIQCIIIPDSGHQATGATVFSNLHQVLDYQGFDLSRVDVAKDQYVFRYGNNKKLKESAPFIVRPGIPNYIAVILGDSTLSVYINGRLISEIPYAGDYADSDRPFMIGNSGARNTPFKGLIYEIKVSGPKIGYEEIKQNYAKIQSIPVLNSL
jgi:tetratricopeptide (TPR) repeat protein